MYLTFFFAHGFQKPLDVVPLRHHITQDQVTLPLSVILVSIDKLGGFPAIESLTCMDELLLLYLVSISAHHLLPK